MAPKKIIITGGSSGIGQALVQRFVFDGWNVAFTYLTHEAEAQELARRTGALCRRCDVRDENSVEAAARDILRVFHRADGLINNAGIAQRTVLEAMTTDEWDAIMAVHLRGTFLWTRKILPGLRDTHGAVLNISSIWGQTGAA